MFSLYGKDSKRLTPAMLETFDVLVYDIQDVGSRYYTFLSTPVSSTHLLNKNNAAIEANDGTAVENSIPVTYAFLPVPTMDGVEESCYGTVDGLVAFRNSNSTDEHIQNVMKALYFLSSGERAAYVDATTCLDGV